ncbi:TetR/AcrR family transcriptional regulator [Nocardia cerradoensis]|uniref:HTH-type transcriptional repressor KstR2 n=1 Tax=Nocardia cerradoensis TaxID=85688 RepID=A0A231GZM0_9NOCA|nr:TetR/AcrR family transcriptional regulator [Nocardia cerradoensis]NKY41883.1 TetR/AcrR family transcriptional regulator [Nocardia cerradoensis]OXR42067.1 HTH-type transcriptional repressor KstR2 [Nocardia cerradoensis]
MSRNGRAPKADATIGVTGRPQDPDRSADRSGLRRELVENELYETAAQLFALKGVAGTTLQDIASAMGVSRQALYYYVKNKDDLIEKVVTEMIEVTRSLSEHFMASEELAPDERLRAVVRALVLQIAERPYRHRLVTQAESMLSGDLAREHIAYRNRFVKDIVATIEAGISDGIFRPVDPFTAAMTILGSCNWTAWWYHGDLVGAQETADSVADMAVRGLISADRQRSSSGTAEGALETIRESLSTLERALRKQSTD